MVTEIRPGSRVWNGNSIWCARRSRCWRRRSCFLNKNVAELSALRISMKTESLHRSGQMLEQLGHASGNRFSGGIHCVPAIIGGDAGFAFSRNCRCPREYVALCRKRLLEGLPERRSGDRSEASIDVQLLVPDATEADFSCRKSLDAPIPTPGGRDDRAISLFQQHGRGVQQSDENWPPLSRAKSLWRWTGPNGCGELKSVDHRRVDGTV